MEEEEEEVRERYIVRPPRDLTSMFEKRMADKEKATMEEERRKKQEEEDAKRAVSNELCVVVECIIELREKNLVNVTLREPFLKLIIFKRSANVFFLKSLRVYSTALPFNAFCIVLALVHPGSPYYELSSSACQHIPIGNIKQSIIGLGPLCIP